MTHRPRHRRRVRHLKSDIALLTLRRTIVHEEMNRLATTIIIIKQIVSHKVVTSLVLTSQLLSLHFCSASSQERHVAYATLKMYGSSSSSAAVALPTVAARFIRHSLPVKNTHSQSQFLSSCKMLLLHSSFYDKIAFMLLLPFIMF